MAQLNLQTRAALADDAVFRSRLLQGLFAKANYHRLQTDAQNLKQQKQQGYARRFLLGGANTIDIYAITRFWLSMYNVENPDMVDGQPSDDAILNTQPLDEVYDLLAGVVPGDDQLPPAQPNP